eukprot:12894271-Prorocentrum_lima.AAC.1
MVHDIVALGIAAGTEIPNPLSHVWQLVWKRVAKAGAPPLVVKCKSHVPPQQLSLQLPWI